MHNLRTTELPRAIVSKDGKGVLTAAKPTHGHPRPCAEDPGWMMCGTIS